MPQHLELDDVIAWGLGALDLLFVGAGCVVGWWLALALAEDVLWRVVVATPTVIVGLVLGAGRFAERPCRTWIALALGYALRPRLLVSGSDK